MKTVVERATVTPIVPVPGLQPGIRPRMLFTRMKKKIVARNPKYFVPSCPIIATAMSLRMNSASASTALDSLFFGTIVKVADREEDDDREQQRCAMKRKNR